MMAQKRAKRSVEELIKFERGRKQKYLQKVKRLQET